MSNEKTKKLPVAGKFSIVTAVLAVVFLVLSIVSVEYSVSRTVKAIENIGDVELTDESKDKIDLAKSYYESLDSNLGLEERITNVNTLTNAEFEYVRLAIKRAYLADKNGEPEEVIAEYVSQAREIFGEYCSAGECTNISNYADLTALEEKYSGAGSAPSSNASDSSEAEEEIELC